MKRRGVLSLAFALFAVSAFVAVIPVAAGKPRPRVPLAMSVSPTSKNFGKVAIDSASIPVTFTVTNTGSSAFIVTSVSFTGADPGAFEVVSSSCGGSLLPAATCTVNVVFAPGSTGTKAGTLRIATSSSGLVGTAGVGGTGSQTGPQPDSAFKQSTGSPVPTANAPCDLVVGYIKNQKGASATPALPPEPDLILTDSVLDQVSVLNGNGKGSFPYEAPRSPSSTGGTRSCGTAAGDLTGDDRDDVVISNEDSDDISVIDGDSDGGLDPTPSIVPTGDDPDQPNLGDIDGDGDEDAVVPNTGDDDTSIFENDGDGDLTPNGPPVPTGDQPEEGDLGDVDEDGDLDFVVPNAGDDDISILDNDGDGNFTPDPSPTPTGGDPRDSELGDMDDDGCLDAVVSNFADDTVSILLGDCSGNFEPDTDPDPTSDGPTDIELGDIDGDGDEDAAILGEEDGKIDIYLGDGEGDFDEQPPGTPIPTDSGNPPLGLEDINGDKVPDVIGTDERGKVPLYLNRLDPDSALRKGTRLKGKKYQRYNRRGVYVDVRCSVNCSYGLKGKGLRSRSRILRGKTWFRVLVPFTADQKKVIERQLARGRNPRVKVTGFAQDAVKERYIYLRLPSDPYPVTG